MDTWIMVAVAVAVLLGSLLVIRSRRVATVGDPTAALIDPTRVAAVHALEVIDNDPIPELDELARRAASMLRTPTAVVSLLDADAQYFPGQFGLGGGPAAVARGGLPYEYSYCKYVVGEQQPLEITDSLRNPLVRDHLATTERGVRAYLGMPIRTRQGEVVGVFCVYDTFTRKWSIEDYAELNRFAQLAMRQMEKVAGPASGEDADQTDAPSERVERVERDDRAERGGEDTSVA